MNDIVVRHMHPAGGELVIDQRRSIVHLHCRWPFDLDQDDWVTIDNEFAMESYESAVADLRRSAAGRVEGVSGGYLAFRDLGNGRLEVDFANNLTGFMSRSLSLVIGATPDDVDLPN